MKNTFLISGLAVLLLSGCASKLLQSNEPAASIYSLHEGRNIAAASVPANALTKIIEIQRPALPPGFDTARIGMYLENGRRIDYYSGARWASPLDEVLQEFTIQTARKTLPRAIVAAPGQSIDFDYRLQIKVNEFQPVYAAGPDQPPILMAGMTFTLLTMPDEKIVTSFTIDQQEVAQSNTLTHITAGLEHLLQSVEAQAFETIARRIFPN